MIKISGFIFAVFFAGHAFANADVVTSCRVTTANDNNPWEEGLAVYGRGDDDSTSVDIKVKNSRIELVSVGQTTWHNGAGSQIESKKFADGRVQYELRSDDSTEWTRLVVYPSERGVILYRESQREKFSSVGTFDCSSAKVVEKAKLKDKNVSLLSKAQVSKLSKVILDNFSASDIGFELGDGYYDVKESKIYQVVETVGSKKVVGFVEWARVYYTEDNEEIEVLVRFDRNGLRLGEIEKL